jgi:uncharacterized protein with HEPN domain
MLDAAMAAQSFAAYRKRADLDSDRQLVFALVKAVEIIGEAAAKLTPELKSQTPHVPWRDIVAMRNRLIHAYFDINLNILWSTIEVDVPQLIVILSRLLDGVEP